MARAGRANPERLNGLFIAPGYGMIQVPVRSLLFGMRIISEEAHSRQKQAMYVTRVTGSSFGIRLHYASRDEFVALGAWLLFYGWAVTNPTTKVGPIRVVVPSMKFDKTGIPESAIPYGESIDDYHYPLDISFEGTSAPITAGMNPGSGWWSKFVLPASHETSEHFYPGGVQLGGSYADEDALYAPVALPVPITIDPKHR